MFLSFNLRSPFLYIYGTFGVDSFNVNDLMLIILLMLIISINLTFTVFNLQVTLPVHGPFGVAGTARHFDNNSPGGQIWPQEGGFRVCHHHGQPFGGHGPPQRPPGPARVDFSGHGHRGLRGPGGRLADDHLTDRRTLPHHRQVLGLQFRVLHEQCWLLHTTPTGTLFGKPISLSIAIFYILIIPLSIYL